MSFLDTEKPPPALDRERRAIVMLTLLPPTPDPFYQLATISGIPLTPSIT